MTRFLLAAVLAAPAAAGCTSIEPVGPLTRPGPRPAAATDDPTADKSAANRPVPPAVLITPGEAASGDPAAAATRLGNEIEYDLKNTPSAPKTPIVSRYKNGEKVE